MDNQNSQTVTPFQLQPAQFPRGIIDPGMLAATPVQAAGDLYYSNGSNFVRLPIGSNGQVLQIKSSLPAWGAVPWPSTLYRASAYLSSNQSISNTTQTKLTLNAIAYDTNGNFDITTNHRYNVALTGYYLITASSSLVDGEGATPPNQFIWFTIIAKNGSAILQNGLHIALTSIANPVCSGIVALTAGDYIELFCYQNSGFGKDCFGNIQYTHLDIHLLSV